MRGLKGRSLIWILGVIWLDPITNWVVVKRTGIGDNLKSTWGLSAEDGDIWGTYLEGRITVALQDP